MLHFWPVLICVNLAFGDEQRIPSDEELLEMQAAFQEGMWNLKPLPYFSNRPEYSALGHVLPAPERSTFLKMAQNRSVYIQDLKIRFPDELKKAPILNWLKFHFLHLEYYHLELMKDKKSKTFMGQLAHLVYDHGYVFLHRYVWFLRHRIDLVINQLQRSPEGETKKSKYWKIMWKVVNGPLWKYF